MSVISTFSWGSTFLFIFQCHWTIDKLEKTALYIIFIVPFFPSFFLFFFLFSFSLGGGRRPPAPSNDTPEIVFTFRKPLLFVKVMFYWQIVYFKWFDETTRFVRWHQPRSVKILQQGPARSRGGKRGRKPAAKKKQGGGKTQGGPAPRAPRTLRAWVTHNPRWHTFHTNWPWASADMNIIRIGGWIY